MCEYCEDTKNIEGMKYTNNNVKKAPSLCYDPDLGTLVLYIMFEVTSDTCSMAFEYPINFCPMCGRALKEQFQRI